MTGSVNCPVTGNDACGFGYCGEGRCYLRDYVVKSASQPVTSTPSLPAQMEAVRRAISKIEASHVFHVLDRDGHPSEANTLHAVLVTLQQHERLEAEIAEMEVGYKNAAELVLTYHGKNERLEAVVKAARPHLIARVERYGRVGGEFAFWGYHCKVCKSDWEAGAHEQHLAECSLAALDTPEMPSQGGE